MKKFDQFLAERAFWGDSWRGAKNMPPQYQTQQPDPHIDTYRAKAIQAITELRERTQDSGLQGMLDDMIHIIQHHSDHPLQGQQGPQGTQQPDQGSEAPWEDDFHRDMEGDQLRLP